jgi:hypothetical protein
MNRPAPSLRFGFRRAIELWQVVLTVFLGTVVVFVPVHLVLWATVAGVFGSLPESGLPDGELLLIAIELLRSEWLALALAVLSSVFALWAWTVLWHAGLVRWFVYSGRKDVRLAEILSRGLFGWWRWARLGITSIAVFLVGQTALGFGFKWLGDRADDSLLGFGLVALAVLSLVLTVLCWLATLRGAWLLGEVHRRSAVLAWLAGLRGTVTQPVRSMLTLVLWVAPGLVASLLPLLAGWQLEVLRDGAPAAVVELVAGLLGAFCWVGLFLSFAPVTGLTEKTTQRDS